MSDYFPKAVNFQFRILLWLEFKIYLKCFICSIKLSDKTIKWIYILWTNYIFNLFYFMSLHEEIERIRTKSRGLTFKNIEFFKWIQEILEGGLQNKCITRWGRKCKKCILDWERGWNMLVGYVTLSCRSIISGCLEVYTKLKGN